MAKIDVRNLGDYIREQRSSAQISLRQLATLAGVSNPYLSQIERGLRKPSAEILQQIAKALRISAEALYVQAGILEERYDDSDVPAAILSDAHLAERQKQVLLELYEAYRREADAANAEDTTSGVAESKPAAAATPKTSRTRTARRANPRVSATAEGSKKNASKPGSSAR
ncbi:MAG: helix-turn-helix domain-containing protein [Frankiaceae bacterium]|nr:helix-turn-helix domain-containing protein [Frankiaceae bacterium]MBV9870257.1 helix-turn-helix domain-containing protein [Frankiaceae bacterium]